MARMKFLCDADRCIECNACVTACKNEHEVPWGINRRRVVTINDGKPGERSVSMACMHCTDAPCAAVCPINCFYTTADAVVLHSKDLCIGCGYCFYACPFGAPQYPRVGNFGSRGKMDKCTYCAGGPEADGSVGRVREVRRQPPRRRQAAAVRRDVLDQVAARRRRRDHRPDLQGAGDQARLRLRRLGLEDRLSRETSRCVTEQRDGATNGRQRAVAARTEEEADGDVAGARCASSSECSRCCRCWRSPHCRPRPSSRARSIRPRARSRRSSCCASCSRSQGRCTHSGREGLTLVSSRPGRDWRHFHEVTLRWIGAIAILGMLAAAGRLLPVARAGEARERAARAAPSCASTRSSASSTG